MKLEEELIALKESKLYRELRQVKRYDPVNFEVNGKKVVQFASNDYLGLSFHPAIKDAVRGALDVYGFGSGASRLVSGNLEPHTELEEKVAAFKKKEATILFPTGYMANIGVITSLATKKDVIILDKLCHASIIDACRQSEADLRVYPHLNYTKCEDILNRASHYEQRFLVTETVFSMDGDYPDLEKLVSLKKKYDAFLIIDEAHGTGVFGESGRGVASSQGVEKDIDVSIGTFSKALGGQGGFVVGDKALISFLQNKARSFIYTTALLPSTCMGLEKALEIVEMDDKRRERLWYNIRMIRRELKEYLMPGSIASPIVPILIGDEEKTLYFAKQLYDKGFFIPPMRYPTVAKGKARLRLSVTSEHPEEKILAMTRTLKQLL